MRPKHDRISEAHVRPHGKGAPLRCSFPDCGGAVVRDECLCRDHWEALPWGMRNDAGSGWRAPSSPSPGWLRDALDALGAPRASLSAGEAMSPREQRRRSVALKVVSTLEYLRPDYATCTGGQHPCPWVSCPSHLYLERMPGGTLHFNHPDKDVDELEYTCAEDVIRDFPDGVSATKAGKLVGVKRGRVGQVERKWRRGWKRVLSGQRP